MSNGNKRYARVENGAIAESNVSLVHIQNRGQDPALYFEVIEDPKPEANQFQYVEESLNVVGRKVIASYSLVDKNIDQILNDLHRARAAELNEFAPGPVMEVPDILITTVDPVITAKVLELVKKDITMRLDSFAQERDYDGIVSLCTYATSNEPKFKAEGQRGVDLRDLAFASMYAYQGEMIAGTAFVPKSLVEVRSHIPELTWQ